MSISLDLHVEHDGDDDGDDETRFHSYCRGLVARRAMQVLSRCMRRVHPCDVWMAALSTTLHSYPRASYTSNTLRQHPYVTRRLHARLFLLRHSAASCERRVPHIREACSSFYCRQPTSTALRASL